MSLDPPPYHPELILQKMLRLSYKVDEECQALPPMIAGAAKKPRVGVVSGWWKSTSAPRCTADAICAAIRAAGPHLQQH